MTVEVTEPGQMQWRLQRLNLILRTIRNVDQIILEEGDHDRLIKRVCNSLVKTRGYFNAWIALLDRSGRFVAFTEAGLGEKFSVLAKQLESGRLTSCTQSVLTQSKAVVINDPASSCTDCPLAKEYTGRGGIAARLQYRGKLYGLLCASVPASLVTEAEECSMFEDVAGDIASALHKIKLEKDHKRAEEALRESENRYRVLFDGANDGMLVMDLEGNIIMANSAMAELTGYTTDGLAKTNILQFLSTSSFETIMENQRRRIEDESETSTQRYELQMVRKDRTERTIDVVTSLLPDGGRSPIIQLIARDITEQKRAEENLRAYASRAILAQEEERKRVARELHDETAQALASLGMDINSLARAKGRDSGEVSRRLEELRDRTSDILRGVRFLSQALRPPMLEELGLLAALQELADDLLCQQEILAEFEVQGAPRRLLPDMELALFRIAQEALSNVGKHARATECSLKVEFSPEKIELRISDNGQGFEVPAVVDDFVYSGKLGLTGMRERAKLIDGTLTISSQPGRGTTVVLEVHG
ncbi:PAS domain S-box protein [Chloroflexota bacterium]